jgi:hypothetical protein
MDDRKMEKWAALSGAVFVLLAVIGTFIAGSPPKVSDPNPKIIKFVVDNQDALKVSSYIAGLGVVFFLVFLGIVWTRLSRAEGGPGRLAGTSAMAGVAVAAIASVGFAINAYSALHPLDSPTTYRLGTVVFGVLSFAALVFVEAASIVIIRTKFLPVWLGWLGMLSALVWLVGGAAVATEDDAIFAVGFASFLVWALWLLIFSVMLFRTSDSATS